MPRSAFVFLVINLCHQFHAMRELLIDLVQRLEALENRSTQLEDWEGFLNQARSLHERALIMRYKALERLSELQLEEAAEPVVPEQPIVWGGPADDAADAVLPEAEEPLELETNEEVTPEPAQEAAAPLPAMPLNTRVSLAEKLSLQPLKSILPALGINDRMRFAGVLFNGDMSALQAACAAAEAAASFESAQKEVINRAQAGLDWSDEAEAPYQFMQLVQRLHLR